MRKFLLGFIIVVVLAPYFAFAHPGRTDKNGCHTNRKTGVYHCHKKKIHKSGRKIKSTPVKRKARSHAKLTARILFEDKDCKDFLTHAEAQAFFIKNGGPKHDPHRLDKDKDGIACEALIN